MSCTLSELMVGQSARIVAYRAGRQQYRARLLAMGLTRGTEVRVTGMAPLGDPIHLELRGYTLSLRREEARVLVLEVEEPVAAHGPS